MSHIAISSKAPNSKSRTPEINFCYRITICRIEWPISILTIGISVGRESTSGMATDANSVEQVEDRTAVRNSTPITKHRKAEAGVTISQIYKRCVATVIAAFTAILSVGILRQLTDGQIQRVLHPVVEAVHHITDIPRGDQLLTAPSGGLSHILPWERIL
jgi:hypothetical protein